MKIRADILLDSIDIALCAMLDDPQFVLSCLDIEEDRLMEILKFITDIRYPEDAQYLEKELKTLLEDCKVKKIYDKKFKNKPEG
jgi:hypothetical protein